MHNDVRHSQRGAVIVTVCLFLLFLLGFMGFALDFGRLFIVKTELQSAMDSCALAAAHELDGGAGALTRATNAGSTAGNMNRVNLQSTNWDGMGQISTTPGADIVFRDAAYAVTTNDASARYAQCTHTQPNVRLWLMQAMGAFGGNAAQYPAARNVAASAVATRGSAQTTCPLPIAMRPKTPGAPAPDYGYAVGDWVTLLVATNDAGQGGYIGWANLDGSNSASETTSEMNGKCGVTVDQPLGTPGVQSAIFDNWNWRFGMYKNNSGPADANAQPDLTGFVYTTRNWPAGRAAYSDFVARRQSFANCTNTTSVNNRSVADCEAATGLSLNGGIRALLPGGPSAVNGHRTYGGNRRVVLVPVTLTYPGRIAGYACMLMLQPISIPKADVQLEYLGNAGDPASPCVTAGLPGGTAGPLVPVLVR